MDRQLLEIVTFFQGTTGAEDTEGGSKIRNGGGGLKNSSLSKRARVVLIANVVLFHAIFAVSSIIALNGNPNKTAIDYVPGAILMLVGGSGATIVCLIAYMKLLRCLNQWSWTLTTLAVIVYEILLFIYKTSLIFHVLLCSFTTLLIAYHLLLINGPDSSHLLKIILTLFLSSTIDFLFDIKKNNGPVVKVLAYLVVSIAALLALIFLDNIGFGVKKATGSLQKKVVDDRNDDCKI